MIHSQSVDQKLRVTQSEENMFFLVQPLMVQQKVQNGAQGSVHLHYFKHPLSDFLASWGQQKQAVITILINVLCVLTC